jgi:fructose-bisphosphate aldolase class I
MNIRLEANSVEGSDVMRQKYRELLLSAPGAEAYLTGVILFDETIRTATAAGVPFPDLLTSQGVMPGIKVDRGLVELPEFPGEKVTEGLDGLLDRMHEYEAMGARFAKWRAAFEITDTKPSNEVIAMNAVSLARYASVCQEAGIVPMVEPEVIMHGSHSRERSEEVTTHVLQVLFTTLREFKVDLSAVILKTSMVIAGDSAPVQTSADEVADATIRALRASVPFEVPAIVYLSGGQTPIRATENLQAIQSRGEQPWKMTFSYSRALEEPVLAAWQGKDENKYIAQAALVHRLKMNSLAQQGKYTKEAEQGR